MEPEALDILKAGAFSVRRTGKLYSRSSIHKALEESVNRDAASPSTGIKSFTTNDSAFRRWCINMTQRSLSVKELAEYTGLQRGETPANQPKNYRIKRDNRDRAPLSKIIDETLNPFSSGDDTKVLSNIATGREAKERTRKYLLGTIERGHSHRDKFPFTK